MAKRFTDTNKYKKPFIRGLQGAYKLLWDYLYHDCDHAGIWIVDFEIAQIYIGSDMPVNKDDALRFFNSDDIRVIEIDDGSKWFIPSFIEFQYGELNENNRAHNSVIQILKKYGLYNNKGLIRGLQAPMDKDMDKDKDKRTEIENLINEQPDKFRPIIKKWFDYKKEKKKSYKLMGGKAAITKIYNLSNNNPDIAMKIINESISNNWDGLFPLKNVQSKTNESETDF